MVVVEKKIEHVISQKRSLGDSSDEEHEHEAFKKSKTLVAAYSSPKTKTQLRETTQFCVRSEDVKSLKKLTNIDIFEDLRYFVDNKDKRLKPPEPRRIHITHLRETGKVKYWEPTRSKHGKILAPKVNITLSRRITSNITNAPHCQIQKTSFDGEDKLVGSKFDENNKIKKTKLPIAHKYCNSLSGDTRSFKSTSTSISQKEVVKSLLEEAKILFDVTYEQASYQNKLEQNGKKNQHLKVLSEVKQIVKQKLNLMDTKKVCGPVPGVEVGNTFKYRQLLDLFGIHCQPISGIDFTESNGRNIAIIIVDSHRYLKESERRDMLTYCGEGGIGIFGPKSPSKDQKLERGNLALKNCIDKQSPVRVIRKIKGDGNNKMYVYDGLYIVKNCVQTRSEEGKTVFKFDLRRIPRQPQLQFSSNTSRYYTIWI